MQLTAVRPGHSACLACLYPEEPLHWKREFPVFGAVSGTVGCLAAMEAIKVLAGFGEPLADAMAHGAITSSSNDPRVVSSEVRPPRASAAPDVSAPEAPPRLAASRGARAQRLPNKGTRRRSSVPT